MGIKEVGANEETLKKNLLQLIELRHVLVKAETFFVDVSDMCVNFSWCHLPLKVEHLVAFELTDDEAEGELYGTREMIPGTII